MSESTLTQLGCPVCGVPADERGACPDCGEDLTALAYLGSKSAIHLGEGLRLARAGNCGAAARALAVALDADPSNVTAAIVLGKVYGRLGLVEDAVSVWKDVLLRDPGNASALAGLSWAQKETGSQQSPTRSASSAEMPARRPTPWWVVVAAGVASFALGVIVSDRPGPSEQTAPPLVPPATTARPTPQPLSAKLREGVERVARSYQGVDVTQDGNVIRCAGSVPSMHVRYRLETEVRGMLGSHAKDVAIDLGGVSVSARYVARPGDSLWAVAAKVLSGADQWERLARANGISSPYRLRPGQHLVVPQ